MTFPSNWAQIPVTGTYLDNSGNPVSGRIYFVSSQVVIAGGSVIIPLRQYVDLVNGSIPAGFTLPSTNDPNISPTGWTYTVIEPAVHNGRPPYAIFVPYNSAGIDLATVAPVVPPPDLVSTQGPPGNTLFATFDVDPVTGELSVTTPSGYLGPVFSIDTSGNLGVTIA